MQLPHSVTLFNRVEDAEGEVSYRVTFLKGLLYRVVRGNSRAGTGEQSRDTAKLYVPLSVSTGEKTYLSPEEYARLSDDELAAHYTFSVKGDFFVLGEKRELADVPMETADVKEIYDVHAITAVEFLDFGNPSLHHWEVSGV